MQTIHSIRAGLGVFALGIGAIAQAAQVDIPGPVGSQRFGERVAVLPDGSFFVADPRADVGTAVDAGVVHLFSAGGELRATLRGTTAGDQLGSGGIARCDDGTVLVLSPRWDMGTTADVGAATWFDVAANGLVNVTVLNSLVGFGVDSLVDARVIPLGNRSCLLAAPNWSEGRGAVVWSSTSQRKAGVIISSIALTGITAGDGVGANISVLANGNYVVASPSWDDGPIVDAGAATFGSANSGVAGLVGVANSLTGRSANDRVGSFVTPLRNGNYVVVSPLWNNGALARVGAVTWAPGLNGISGPVGTANSLVGSSSQDQVGGTATFLQPSLPAPTGPANGVVALANGHYVVGSPFWDSGGSANHGAATFASGDTGLVGVVSTGNSLVGAQAEDRVGFRVAALGNGHYVVVSPAWNAGAVRDVGAVTWASGAGGLTGTVAAGNSFIGNEAGAQFGYGFMLPGVVPVGSDHFVVQSFIALVRQDSGFGTFTFLQGSTAPVGVLGAANSLYNPDDAVPSTSVLANGSTLALANGNYAVIAPVVGTTGAVVWGSGTVGASGPIDAGNALLGAVDAFPIGRTDTSMLRAATALANGNFVVRTWGERGAVSVVSGSGPTVGTLSSANALLGATPGDYDAATVRAYPNSSFVVHAPRWNTTTALTDSGAVILARGDGSTTGTANDDNAVFGIADGEGASTVFEYDPSRDQLIVGQPASNRVVLLRPGLTSRTVQQPSQPDPSPLGTPATFTARVSAALAPTDGRVTFRAENGASCVDSTPTAFDATTAQFSCNLVFDAPVNTRVVAEYSGSATYGFSASAREAHQARPVLTITPAALPGGVFGQAYGQILAAEGVGTQAPVAFALAAGSLPPGLALNGAAIGGTPAAAGTFGFTIAATDSSPPGVGGPFTSMRAYTVVVARAEQAALTVTATPGSIRIGSSATLATSGGSGTGSVGFSVTTGASVCELAAGTVTGVAVGSCTITATRLGDANFHPATATVDLVVEADTPPPDAIFADDFED